MSDNDFYKGEVVFDKKRTDPTDDLLVIVNPEMGPVGSLEGETRRLVKNNDTNCKILGASEVPDDAECVAAAYISSGEREDPEIGDNIYTFPDFRLQTVKSKPSDAIEGYQPYQWALAGFMSELVKALDNQQFTIETIEDLQVLCMEADVDGEVITKGTQWGLGTTAEPPEP